jgi:uncharacterized protein YgiB involved in biofilm formation
VKAQYSEANTLTQLQIQCHVLKTLDVNCHSDDCNAAGGRSAACRNSWVCLQHHATVVKPNAVTKCGSKFPPTVNKHWQHQNSANSPNHTSKAKYQQNPAVVISKVLLPQSNIMAGSVHSHRRFFSDDSSGLQTYRIFYVTQCTVFFSSDTSCWLPQFPSQNVQLST